MKTISRLFRRIWKTSLLLALILVGWAYFNVTNLFKGRQEARGPEDLSQKDLWGIGEADADSPPPGGGCGGCVTSSGSG